MSVDEFDSRRSSFKDRICSLFEESPCSPAEDVIITAAKAGSCLIDFKVRVTVGGPTRFEIRRAIENWDTLRDALATDFVLGDPSGIMRVEEDVEHESAAALAERLLVYKALFAITVIFILDGIWGIVLAWSLTSRGDACRRRAHSGWRARYTPSSETLQVLVLSVFVQLIMAQVLYLFFDIPPGDDVLFYLAVYCVLIGMLGTLFNFVFNAWIRGESASLMNALSVDKIDKKVAGWDDASDDDEDEGAHREYSQVYEPGAARSLGAKAGHDWEASHLLWEKRMGLMDLSDQVFDAKPEHDPGMLSAFLNSSLLSAFGGRKKDQDKKGGERPPPRELAGMAVSVPTSIAPVLRDAMLQWRLRNNAHPLEAEAIGSLLGQLDKSFSLLSVQTPEQVRSTLIDAILSFSHNHPELQLDACYAARLQATLQQLSLRFHSMPVELPPADEAKPSEDTTLARKVLLDALRHRVGKSARDLTLEEGMLLQQTMHQLSDAFMLCPMETSNESVEQMQAAIKEEVERRADVLKNVDESEKYTKVPLLQHSAAADLVMLKAGRSAVAADRPPSSPPPSPPHAQSAPQTPSGLVRAALKQRQRSLTRGQRFWSALHARAVGSPPPSPPEVEPLVTRDDGSEVPGDGQPFTLTLPAYGAESVHDEPSGDLEPLVAPLITSAPAANAAPPSTKLPPQAKKKRHKPKREAQMAGSDQKMPCWKQYFVLILGSTVVLICNITAVTFFNSQEPLETQVVLFSWAGAVPFSFIFHIILRTVGRIIRRRRALERGRQVQGIVDARSTSSKADLRKQSLTHDRSVMHLVGRRKSLFNSGRVKQPSTKASLAAVPADPVSAQAPAQAWTRQVNPANGQTYYWNSETDESTKPEGLLDANEGTPPPYTEATGAAPAPAFAFTSTRAVAAMLSPTPAPASETVRV